MKKTINIIAIMLIIFLCFNNSYALSKFEDTISQADTFFNANNATTAAGTDSVGVGIANIFGKGGTVSIVDMLTEIGNVIIFILVMVLGIKYMFTSIEGKADIKGSLPNLVLGIMFFYLAQGMYNIVKGLVSDNPTNVIKNTVSTVSTVANVCAILAIVMLGLKYMFTSADGKADVKKQLGPMAIGIIMIYSTLKVITIIYKLGQSIV